MTFSEMKEILGAVKLALECGLIAVALVAMNRASTSREEAIETLTKTREVLAVAAQTLEENRVPDEIVEGITNDADVLNAH